MKKYFLLLLLFSNVILAFGQIQKERSEDITEKRQPGRISFNIDHFITDKDVIEIIDLSSEDTHRHTLQLVFVNGNQYSKSLLPTLDVSQIKSFRIEKSDTIIDNVPYSDRICVTTLENYTFNPVTLESIKEIYVKNEPVVFVIDGKIISEDISGYFINKDNILQITKGKVQSLGLYYLSILTKTDENREKTKNYYEAYLESIK